MRVNPWVLFVEIDLLLENLPCMRMMRLSLRASAGTFKCIGKKTKVSLDLLDSVLLLLRKELQFLRPISI